MYSYINTFNCAKNASKPLKGLINLDTWDLGFFVCTVKGESTNIFTLPLIGVSNNIG